MMTPCIYDFTSPGWLAYATLSSCMRGDAVNVAWAIGSGIPRPCY
jgi:hypothetical protein